MERIFKEGFDFDKIIKNFEIIYSLKEIKQNPKYHKEGNVFIHTKNVCKELIKLKEWNFLSFDEKITVYMAALFHDIGKITCTKVENNEIVSPKHAIRGSKTFREICYKEYEEKFNISFKMRENIASLIKYHGFPLVFLEKDSIDYELIKVSECLNMNLLYILSKADVLGRECSDKELILNKVEYFREYSIEIGCFYEKIKFFNEYTRFKYFKDNNIWYKDEIFDVTSFKVIVMCGLPLAGKDTYIKENFKEIEVISLDDIREEFNISPRENSGKVVNIGKERAKKYLREKTSFVWNATNLVAETRKKLIDLFSSYGAKVEIIYVEARYKELLKRNKKRERTIPINILNKMIHKFDFPEAFEGYYFKTYKSLNKNKFK